MNSISTELILRNRRCLSSGVVRIIMVGHTMADCRYFLKLRKPGEPGCGRVVLMKLGAGGRGGGGVVGALKAPHF